MVLYLLGFAFGLLLILVVVLITMQPSVQRIVGVGVACGALCVIPVVGEKVNDSASAEEVVELLEVYKGLDGSLSWGVEEKLKSALSDKVLSSSEVSDLLAEMSRREFGKMADESEALTKSFSEKTKAIGTLALEICARNPEHKGC